MKVNFDDAIMNSDFSLMLNNSELLRMLALKPDEAKVRFKILEMEKLKAIDYSVQPDLKHLRTIFFKQRPGLLDSLVCDCELYSDVSKGFNQFFSEIKKIRLLLELLKGIEDKALISKSKGFTNEADCLFALIQSINLEIITCTTMSCLKQNCDVHLSDAKKILNKDYRWKKLLGQMHALIMDSKTDSVSIHTGLNKAGKKHSFFIPDSKAVKYLNYHTNVNGKNSY